MIGNSLLSLVAVTSSKIKAEGLPKPAADSASIADILSIVFSIIGALALLVIVISGLRYILATGDPQKTAKAKEGIVYALVGLAVALMAQAIVVFVVKRL